LESAERLQAEVIEDRPGTLLGRFFLSAPGRAHPLGDEISPLAIHCPSKFESQELEIDLFLFPEPGEPNDSSSDVFYGAGSPDPSGYYELIRLPV